MRPSSPRFHVPIVRTAVFLVLAAVPPAFGAGQAIPGPRTVPVTGRTSAKQAALPRRVVVPAGVVGPGAVLTAGNVRMKVTNWGHLGNLFPDLSGDPSGQWPDSTGAEYLSSIRLAVAAVNPAATDPAARHLVSESLEWTPPSADHWDGIYQTSEGAVNGARFVNDDRDLDWRGEPLVDEDFLDGHDNDADGKIDEDFAAIGQQMFALTMRDDTPEAIKSGIDEPHVPIGLACQQSAWAYSVPGFRDFDVVDYRIINYSGHLLDSLTVGWLVDMDCGADFRDDLDLPGFPSGEFTLSLPETDPRRQWPHAAVPDVSADSALCPRLKIRVNGFAVADDDGDGGATPGVPAFLLVDHTLDQAGLGPARVGFHSFRSAIAGVPYEDGGLPSNDAERFAFMESGENVDPATGFITQAPGSSPGDYVQWCSVGPFRNVPDGGSVHVTIAFAVAFGNHADALSYPSDYASYRNGTLDGGALLRKHPALRNAFDAQVAFEGGYDQPGWDERPDFHGRETLLEPKSWQGTIGRQDCHDDSVRSVTYPGAAWFDFDCDYCTGVWDESNGQGYLHHTWLVPTELLSAPQRPDPPEAIESTPNPTRSGTRFGFRLGEAGRVRAAIYDVQGRQVRRLADRVFGAGRHDLWWDGRDAAGEPVAAGVYLCRLFAGPRTFGSRVVVTR